MGNKLSLGVCAFSVLLLFAAGRGATTQEAATKEERNVSSSPASQPLVEKPTTEPAQKQTPSARIAHIRLTGRIMDSPPEFSLFWDLSRQKTLRHWLHRLAKARDDERVTAVALEIDSPKMSWAQSQELALAVSKLQAVKPVYTYLAAGRIGEYLVASAAGEVSMEPAGTIGIIGVGAELLFFRGTLDLLGIEPQFIQIGRFKSAAEPLTQTQPSQPMRQIYESVLDDLYEQLADQIARQRSLEISTVKQAIDLGPFRGEQALELKLVDKLIEKLTWRDHVTDSVSSEDDGQAAWIREYGRRASRAVDSSNPFAMLRLLFGETGKKKTREPTIAFIHAEGLITSGQSGQGLFGQRISGARTLLKCFRDVEEDTRIKAVIFRINSPGGSALASELIYQAVKRCARSKPVIISISQIGASGGYYIAAAGDTIFADPSAIVGSIGVISGKLAITGLLDKIGITRFEITRGKNAGLWMSRPWNDSELSVIRKHTEAVYDLFVRRVAQSRAGRIKNIETVAEGRIFTARQAVNNGLVDQLGGLSEAVVAAKKAANIEKCYYISLPRPRTLIDVLRGDDEINAPHSGRLEWIVAEKFIEKSPGVAYLLNLAALLGKEQAIAALPYYLEIRR